MIVKDEEHNIARCIKSVKDVEDEIMVVDTVPVIIRLSIAKSFGAKVFSCHGRIILQFPEIFL